MILKLNPTTGNLDVVNKSSAATSNTTLNIPAGATVDIDTVTLAGLRSINYFISIFKPDFTQSKSFEMTVSRINASVNDSVYAIVGNFIDASIVSNVVGPDVIIQVTNNEAFDLTFIFNKTVLN